jgi:DNA-binding XRE family transcriptional regulator
VLYDPCVQPEDNDVLLGREAVASGHLQALREQVGLTQAAMADLVGVDPTRYRLWERETSTRLWTDSARRIGRFYRSAMRQVGLIEEMGYKPGELIPFMSVAPLLGITHEVLLRRYRKGEVQGVDLGVLGTWMTRENFQGLTK